MAIKRELGDRQGIANSLNNLGESTFDLGDYPAAWALYEESLAIRRALGDQRGIADSLQNLARVAFPLRGPDQAARIWGGMERLRKEFGTPLAPSAQPGYDRHVAAARAALGDEAAFDLAWQEGHAMTLEQVIEYALQKRDV